MKPVVFISHIHDEANVANWLKNSISKLLLSGIEFFVSSDRTAIIGGDRWLNKIEGALRKSPVVLVLCSKQSVLRPWINFEAGGAWIAGKRVIPICHGEMEPASLPVPLNSLQAYNLRSEQDYRDLVEILAKKAGLNIPEFDSAQILKNLPKPDITNKQNLINGKNIDDKRIRYGSLLSGKIEEMGEVVDYTFAGKSNELVSLTLVKTSDWKGYANSARVTVLSPTGEQILFMDANRQENIKLPETGIYSIQINANNLVSMGSYNFGIKCIL